MDETQTETAPDAGENKCPEDVWKAITDAEAKVSGDEAYWHESLAFYGNDQYVEVSAITGNLDRLEVREGGSKPRSRPRPTRNRMTKKVIGETSMLTARVPGWDLAPPNGDPRADNQARKGEMVLRAKHEDLELDMRAMEVIIYSILTGGGFAVPFWDPDVGKFVADTEDGRALHQGDVGVEVLHQGEVLWDASGSLEKSRWVCIKRAKSVSRIKELARINKDKINANAQAGMWDRPNTGQVDMGFVYDYFRMPRGRDRGTWLTIHDKHLIDRKKPYPRSSGRPVVHKLAWFPRPDQHRDFGAGPILVAAQRGYNRAHAQAVSWRNHILNPQMTAPVGSDVTEQTDEEGAIIYFRPINGMRPEWRDVPEVPQSIWTALDRALEDMDDVLGRHELPAGVESGSGVERISEYSEGYRAMFLKQLARFWANLGEHILELVQERYTERRLIEAEGMFGVDRIPDFLGRDLQGIGRLRVSPASITPRTREQQEMLITMYADRGWVEPHQAMKALDAGNIEILINELELDEAYQQREIRTMMTLEARLEGDTESYGGKLAGMQDSGRLEAEDEDWLFPMPTEIDNHLVHMDTLRLWMKTRDFQRQHPMVKEWARDHYKAHQMLVMQEQQAADLEREQAAAAMGDANAAKQPSTGQPSRPKAETLVEN